MIHPIELESYRILADRIDLGHLTPGVRAVVQRVVHASADLDYARTMVVDEAAVRAGVAAIRQGAVVVADVEMTRAGVSGVPARCYLAEVDRNGPHRGTRSAEAMRLAAERHRSGAVVVIGCAPTALDEAVALVTAGRFAPAVMIGMPVGFVGAAAAKDAARRCGALVISNVGEKGGSAVAAAACNALIRLAHG